MEWVAHKWLMTLNSQLDAGCGRLMGGSQYDLERLSHAFANGLSQWLIRVNHPSVQGSKFLRQSRDGSLHELRSQKLGISMTGGGEDDINSCWASPHKIPVFAGLQRQV